MPTTPLRGWPYPAFEENPYYTTIVSTFEAMDTDVHALTRKTWRGVFVGNSTTIANTTADTYFDKSVSIADAVRVAGSLMTISARMWMTTNGASTLIVDVYVGTLRFAYCSLSVPAAMSNEVGLVAHGVLTSATAFLAGPSFIGVALQNEFRLGTTFSQTPSTMAGGTPYPVQIRITMSEAHASTAIRLQSLLVQIDAADSVVT